MRASAWWLLAMLIAVVACDGADPTGAPPPTEGPEVALVEVDPPAASILVGDTVRLTARPKAADGRVLGDVQVVWTSLSGTLATVAGDGHQGRVTASGAGVAVITATAGGKTGQAELTIADTTTTPPPAPGPVASVTIDADSASLAEGGRVQLAATARDASGREVTGRFVMWTSSDPSVAAVGALGEVTGVRGGSAEIRARVDGVEAAIPARVTADYPYSLVFASWAIGDGTSNRLYETEPGDPERAQVRVGPDAPTGDPAPSPDGTRLAYLLELGNGLRSLMVASFDGSGAVELHTTGDVSCGNLAWSPDGERLAFSCRIGDDDPDIWVVDADGGNLVNLTDAHPGRQEQPSWSPARPDGSYRIAYAQFVNGEPQIWTMKDDGSDARQVTSGMDWQPAWSPDGTTIAFQRTGAAIFGDIWLVDAEGGNERGLVGAHLAGPQWSPAWSPDGRLLAFSSTHETYGSGETVGQIYTVWADGSKLARRTVGDDQKGAPAWRAR